MPNYRPVKETYPFFENTFCIGENGRVGLINAMAVVGYHPLDPPRGTKVVLNGGGSFEIFDSLADFEDRLIETLSLVAVEEVEEAARNLVDPPSLDPKTTEANEQKRDTKKK